MRISDWSSDVCSSDLVSDQFVKFLLIGAFVVREHVKHLNDEVDPLRRAVGLLLGHYVAFAKDARLVLENELRLLAAIEDDGLIDDGLLDRKSTRLNSSH